MKRFPVHLAPLPRRFSAAPPVQSIGYMPAKTEVVDGDFSTFNYSFILSGNGFYKYRDRRMPVKAPCVLTQWPEEHMHYWPEPEWEELYFIYHIDNRPALQQNGFIPPNEPMWYLESGARLQEKFTELVRLVENVTRPFIADRIDLLCQSIIMESRISRTPSPLMAEERVIREIENHVRKDVTGYYDFDLLARKYDLHPAKFRRYWNRYIGMPPAKYMMKLRMAEAARLLVETAMPVGEVARAVGFVDELYFSKKFRKEYGLPATVYRQNHHKNLSLKDLPVTRLQGKGSG